MFTKSKKTKLASEKQPVVTPKRRLTDERDLMRSRRVEIAKCEQAISEIEANVQRLETIIADAAAADKALHDAVAGDGAQSLQDFANGKVSPDSDIAKLVTNAESTSRAAVFARAALPGVQAQLASARQQLGYLQDLHRAAVREFMLMLANEAGRKYMTAYKELTAAYDEMRGVSDALPPVSSTEPEIRMSGQPIHVPSFNLPSVRGGTEWLETKAYPGNEHAIQSATSKWSGAFDRLLRDPEADVSELLGDVA